MMKARAKVFEGMALCIRDSEITLSEDVSSMMRIGFLVSEKPKRRGVAHSAKAWWGLPSCPFRPSEKHVYVLFLEDLI